MFTRVAAVHPHPPTFGTRQPPVSPTPSFLPLRIQPSGPLGISPLVGKTVQRKCQECEERREDDLPLRIQPKLTVGPVDDPFEREADQMAERVVNQTSGLLGISPLLGKTVQRECDLACGCDDDSEDGGESSSSMEIDGGGAGADVSMAGSSSGDGDVEISGSGEGSSEDSSEEMSSGRGSRRDQGGESRKRKAKKQTAKQTGKKARSARRKEIGPLPPTLAQGGEVPGGVETSLRQAKGGGQPLSAGVRGPMEQAFRTDFHLVRVHANDRSDRASRSLGARAFTIGSDIFFRSGEYRPESRVGQRLLAHELTHVVQQTGAALPGHSAGGAPGAIQRAFAPKKFKHGVKVNTTFPGNRYSQVSTQPKTGCGIENSITTDGEKYDEDAESNPGTPTHTSRYRGKLFSRQAGLLADRSYNSKNPNCVTKMHLINHHLDPAEGEDGTQGNKGNILLGTQASNKRHATEVEADLKSAISAYRGNGKNRAYEDEMKKVESDGEGLVWPEGEEPNLEVVPEDKLTEKDGRPFLSEEAGRAAADFRHLWVVYRVKAVYDGPPKYVKNNIKHERKKNDPKSGVVEDRIKEFEDEWAPQAFPSKFTCFATYYWASFNKNNHYLKKDFQSSPISTSRGA